MNNESSPSAKCKDCGAFFTSYVGDGMCPKCEGDVCINCGTVPEEVYVEHDMGGGIAGGHEEMRCKCAPKAQQTQEDKCSTCGKKMKLFGWDWLKCPRGHTISVKDAETIKKLREAVRGDDDNDDFYSLTPHPMDRPIRVSLDHHDFQRLVRGGTTTTKGFQLVDGKGTEPAVEIALQDIGYDTMLTCVQRPTIDLIEKYRLTEQDVFLPILDKMDKYGGSFVKQLVAMARRADPVNRVKCLLAWSNYFIEYHEKP